MTERTGSRRVVITGIGLVTPLGIGTEATWSSVREGVPGVRAVSRFDPSDLRTRIAGEVDGFDPTLYMEPKDAKRNDRFIQFSIAAAALALRDAGLEITEELSPRAGTFIGSGIGGMQTFYETVLTMENRGPSRVSPFFIPNIVTNMASGYVSIHFNARGPNCSSTTACSASGHALALSAEFVRDSKADVMITGGAEAPLIPLTFAAFNSMRALSTRNEEPATASRPFEVGRDGFILSEGAGVLVLEELDFAKKRGAKIYAEVLGSGMSADAYHITAPSLDGPVSCMTAALSDSGLDPGDVDYINAHGTSTRLNDANETNAIKTVFGDHARKIPVSSTKSMTGHMLGAAGGVEAAVCALAIRDGVIPPTINLFEADPECDLDYVPHAARDGNIKVALSNSYGFGGTNVSVALGSFD